MKIQEKYLKALESTTSWITVAEWAQLVGDTYPDLLVKADIDAANQKQDTTGLREIAALQLSGIIGQFCKQN